MQHGSADTPRPARPVPGVVRAAVLGALVAGWLVGAPGGAAQEPATPDAPATAMSGATAATSPDVLPGAPHLQTIAQGVVTIDGPITWRVRELTLGSTGAPEAGDASFSLQRSGATVIRDELTGRRVRLDAGEAKFLPAGDPFLRFAVGASPSLLWTIEMLSPEAAGSGVSNAGTVLFTSDATNDYPRGTFETELARNVLLPGEVAILPPYTGPALVLVTSGEVEASLDGGQVTRLQAGTARLVSGNASLRNTDTQPAAIVVVGLGEPIDGVEAGATAQLPQADTALPTVPAQLPPVATVPAQPATVPELAPTPVPQVAPVPTEPAPPDQSTLDTDGDNIADIDEINIYGTDPYAWDTDGDGLGDGEEVFGYGTDPLSWDTDGDGVSDGDEVNVYGTNALDPTSGP